MTNPRPYYVSLAYSHAPTDPRVRRHCEALAASGWRVVQLGIGTEGERPIGRVGGVILVRWQRSRYRGSALWRYALSYLSFMIWCRAMTKRLSRHRRVHVVQVNNVPTYLIWAAIPVRKRGARIVLDIHDPEPELFLSKFSRRPGARLGARLLEMGECSAARRADLVFCVHEHHRRLTEQHGVPQEKIRVVVNYADGRVFRLGEPRRSAPVVGYHGTVSRRMALDIVLRGIAVLRQRGVMVRGAVYGDGDDVARLRTLQGTLGLEATVDIPGERFRIGDLLPKIQEFGIGIVPLRRDPLTDIMLPTKLIEYVRLGIPAVVCWTPTVADHFPDDSVYYVRNFTPDDLADVLQRVLAEPAEAQVVARRAQQLPIARAWQEAGAVEYVDIMRGLAGAANG